LWLPSYFRKVPKKPQRQCNAFEMNMKYFILWNVRGYVFCARYLRGLLGKTCNGNKFVINYRSRSKPFMLITHRFTFYAIRYTHKIYDNHLETTRRVLTVLWKTTNKMLTTDCKHIKRMATMSDGQTVTTMSLVQNWPGKFIKKRLFYLYREKKMREWVTKKVRYSIPRLKIKYIYNIFKSHNIFLNFSIIQKRNSIHEFSN